MVTPIQLNTIQGDLRRIVAQVTKEIVEQRAILAEQRIIKWRKSHPTTATRKS